MRKPLPTTFAAALALALAAPLAFAQTSAPRATTTNVTPTNGSTAIVGTNGSTSATGTNGSTATTSSAASTTGTTTSRSVNPPPITSPAATVGTTSSNTANASTTGTTAATSTTATTANTTGTGQGTNASVNLGASTAATGTTSGQTSGTGTGSTSSGATGLSSTTANVNRAILGSTAVANPDGTTTVTFNDGTTQTLTPSQFANSVVGGASGIGQQGNADLLPANRALTAEEERLLRERQRTEQQVAGIMNEGRGMIVVNAGTPQARVLTVSSLEMEKAMKKEARRMKNVPRNGQLLNMIVPRTDNDRTDQMPDDKIIRY